MHQLMHQDHPPSENDCFHPQLRPVRFQYLTAKDDEMIKTTNVFKVEHLKSGKITSKWVNQWILIIIYTWWVNHLVFCFWWVSSNLPFRTNHEDPRPFVFVLLICSVARKLMSCFSFPQCMFLFFSMYFQHQYSNIAAGRWKWYGAFCRRMICTLWCIACAEQKLPKLPTKTTTAKPSSSPEVYKTLKQICQLKKLSVIWASFHYLQRNLSRFS